MQCVIQPPPPSTLLRSHQTDVCLSNKVPRFVLFLKSRDGGAPQTDEWPCWSKEIESFKMKPDYTFSYFDDASKS